MKELFELMGISRSWKAVWLRQWKKYRSDEATDFKGYRACPECDLEKMGDKEHDDYWKARNSYGIRGDSKPPEDLGPDEETERQVLKEEHGMKTGDGAENEETSHIIDDKHGSGDPPRKRQKRA